MPVLVNDVDVANGVRVVTATVEQVRHEIPEHWIMARCRVGDCSVLEAIRQWHDQAVMAAEWNANHA